MRGAYARLDLLVRGPQKNLTKEEGRAALYPEKTFQNNSLDQN
jgi:hypothetical protein